MRNLATNFAELLQDLHLFFTPARAKKFMKMRKIFWLKINQFTGKQRGVAYTYFINTDRNLPKRARLRGVDVGGNPPVNQRDRVKDKDRNQTKAPSVAL